MNVDFIYTNIGTLRVGDTVNLRSSGTPKKRTIESIETTDDPCIVRIRHELGIYKYNILKYEKCIRWEDCAYPNNADIIEIIGQTASSNEVLLLL